MAAEIKKDFDVDAELISGERGDFEVWMDDKLIFSKKGLVRFPDEGEVSKIIKRA